MADTGGWSTIESDEVILQRKTPHTELNELTASRASSPLSSRTLAYRMSNSKSLSP
jgi:hypothetical protein